MVFQGIDNTLNNVQNKLNFGHRNLLTLKLESMKQFQIFLIVVLITISAILVFFSEFTKAPIPYLKISTEILGLYILFFVMKLYISLNLDNKDLLWAVSSIYTISFLISLQELRVHNNDFAVSFLLSIFLALVGIALSAILCLFREHLKKSF